MNVQTVDTTAMDPIVFASTWNAADELAGKNGMQLNYGVGPMPFELKDAKTGLLRMNFSSILTLRMWLNMF